MGRKMNRTQAIIGKGKVTAYHSEFKPSKSDSVKKKENLAVNVLGICGCMVGASKSIYSYDHPNNIVVFNANILTKTEKIWYGDLDLTKSHKKLKALAKELNEPIYVLYESAGRFGKELEKNAYMDCVAFFDVEGGIGFNNPEHYTKTKSGVPKMARVKYVVGGSDLDGEKVPDHVYFEKDFSKTYKLPDIKTLKGTSKVDPLSQFQMFFIKKLGKTPAVSVWSKLYVSKEYMDALEKNLLLWTKKYHKDLHPAKIEQAVAWHCLDMAPMNFMNHVDWVKKGWGYVKR